MLEPVTYTIPFENLGEITARGVASFSVGRGRLPKIYDARGASVYVEVNGNNALSFFDKKIFERMVIKLNCEAKTPAPTPPSIQVTADCCDPGDQNPPPRYA